MLSFNHDSWHLAPSQPNPASRYNVININGNAQPLFGYVSDRLTHENTQKAAQRHIDIQPKDYFQTSVICKFCENGSLPTLNTDKLFRSSVCHLASQHIKQIREELLDFSFL